VHRDRWRPTEGERYFTVFGDGHIRQLPWHGAPFDDDAWQFGNCFRRQRDAEHAQESMHKLFRPGRRDEGRGVSTMDKETLTAQIVLRLRSLLPYYANTQQEDAFYLVRETDLTRVAESLADFLKDDDTHE
jgi:hypothetical protein